VTDETLTGIRVTLGDDDLEYWHPVAFKGSVQLLVSVIGHIPSGSGAYLPILMNGCEEWVRVRAIQLPTGSERDAWDGWRSGNYYRTPSRFFS